MGFPLNSGAHWKEPLPYTDGIYLWVAFAIVTFTSDLASSWEFFMTLDYEFNVIKKNRLYRWAISARDARFLPSIFLFPNLQPWNEGRIG